jgi:ABC-type sulfate transport system permease component
MGDAFVTMLQVFVDSIVKNIDPAVSAADAKATLAAAIAGRTSIQTGAPVVIENPTNEPSSEGMTENEIPVSRSST